jgi:hypothetical protein
MSTSTSHIGTGNDVPVLLLVFNRPDTLKRVLEALTVTKPQTVYIAADGPRANNQKDTEACAEVRALCEKLPWECTVHRRYSAVNQGCKQGPVNGISWFFSQVPQGIILEDDCVPDPTFFSFASTLLKRYCDDESVMHISGTSFLPLIGAQISEPYYLSRIAHGWQ